MINRLHIKECTAKAMVTLTVSESKRLIAKGLKAYAPLQERLKHGTVIVTKGSTNTYLAEELLGKKIRSGAFVVGHTLPEKGKQKVDRSKTLPELVLRNGESKKEVYTDILSTLEERDIILKGANIINYEKQQAGVMIAHPTGGTTGNINTPIEHQKLHLIIPVGLEKCTGQDIDALSELSQIDIESLGPKVPYIWSVKGELFTEIEALKALANVKVLHLASGGIGGAEGAVNLVILGTEEAVYKAKDIIKEIQGEKEFIN